MTPRPDPLSAAAEAILSAPRYERRSGPLTPAVAQGLRAAQAAARRPVVEQVAAGLGVTAERIDVGGVPVVRVTPPAPVPGGGQALFFHGGGFVSGMAHDMTAVTMAAALGAPVLSVDYVLAPEAQYPVALDQAVEVYRGLVADGSPLVVFGVSAGANLALALAHRIRAERLPQPAALGLFTPWTDLTGEGDSRAANADRDPVICWPDELEVGAAAYAGAADLDDPLVSPIYAAYGGDFPPSIITTGTRDLFLSDCTRLYWAMRRGGATVQLRVWENLWHAFNTQHAMPEAAEARGEVASFLRAALAVSPRDVVP